MIESRSQSDSNSNSRDAGLPNSRRVYVAGDVYPEIRVPFREVTLKPTKGFDGKLEANESVRLYDCMGPWGDKAFVGDVAQGLPALRRDWVLRRGDVEESAAGNGQVSTANGNGDSSTKAPSNAHAAHPPGRNSLRAKPGEIVTQLQYARHGIVTPEMEFIAIRENLGRQQGSRNGHPSENGNGYSGERPQRSVREFQECRVRSAK